MVKTEERKSICMETAGKKRILGESKVTRGVITGTPVEENLEKLKRL